MIDLTFSSLGEAWINLVHSTVEKGVPMGGDEGCELLQVAVTFPAGNARDAIVDRFGDRTMIAEMEKVAPKK